MRQITKTFGLALLFLLVSVGAVALFTSAAFAQAEWAHERSCSFVSIPQVIEGCGMEWVVGGDSHLPSGRRT